MKKKKRRIGKRDSLGHILPNPEACERSKRRREKRRNTKKAKALRDKMPPQDKRTGAFLQKKSLTDEQLISRLLKMKMREIPKTIPVSLMVVKSRPNPNHQSWGSILAEQLVLGAAGYQVSGGIEFLKLILDRVEGKVPDSTAHGLDEYSPELIKLIKELIK